MLKKILFVRTNDVTISQENTNHLIKTYFLILNKEGQITNNLPGQIRVMICLLIKLENKVVENMTIKAHK